MQEGYCDLQDVFAQSLPGVEVNLQMRGKVSELPVRCDIFEVQFVYFSARPSKSLQLPMSKPVRDNLPELRSQICT